MFIKYNIWEEVYLYSWSSYEIVKWIVEEIIINSDGVFLTIKVISWWFTTTERVREHLAFPSTKTAKEFLKNKVIEKLENI